MKSEELSSMSKKDLSEIARKMDIAGRSAMSKEELVRAIARSRIAAGPKYAAGST